MAVPLWDGVRLSSVGRKLHRIVEILVGNDSGYYITSGTRNTNDNHGRGLAIDIGFGGVSTAGSRRGRDLAKKLYAHSGDTLELIHTTPYSTDNGFYVKNGDRVGWNFYGASTNNAHRDHVHFAATSAGADRILAKLGDDGGSTDSAPRQIDIAFTPWTKRPNLKRGDSGGAVGHLQFLLRDRLGHKVDKIAGSPFGPQTEAAVTAREKKWWADSVADGKVYGATWIRLELDAAQIVSPDDRPVLKRGSVSSWTGYAQYCLREAGYDIDDLQHFPFGPQTDAAVRAFQRKYDWLEEDGIIGRATWTALDPVAFGDEPVPPGGTPEPEPEPEPEPVPEPEIPASVIDLMKELLAALKEL